MAVPLDGSSDSGFVAEFGRVFGDDDGSVTLVGNTRAYAVDNYREARSNGRLKEWQLFHLAGKVLKFTVDVSRVPCSCNAALYFVAMRDRYRYCDIQSRPSCTEIDVFEANAGAIQATVHTRTGSGGDGTCNQWGVS